MKMNYTLREIDLSYNSIGNEGVKWISDGLRNNSSVLKLDLSANGIGPEGMNWILTRGARAPRLHA